MLPKRNGRIWNPPLRTKHKNSHPFCRGRHPWRPVCLVQCFNLSGVQAASSPMRRAFLSVGVGALDDPFAWRNLTKSLLQWEKRVASDC